MKNLIEIKVEAAGFNAASWIKPNNIQKFLIKPTLESI